MISDSLVGRDYVIWIAKAEGVRPSVLLGGCKSRYLVKLRARIARYLREVRHMSYPEIGRALNRHHVTVMWLLRGGRTKRNVINGGWA